MNKYTITYNAESIRRLCFTAERIPSGIEVLFNFWEASQKTAFQEYPPEILLPCLHSAV